MGNAGYVNYGIWFLVLWLERLKKVLLEDK